MKSRSALFLIFLPLNIIISFQAIGGIKASTIDSATIKIEPEVTVVDNTLKPKIIFRDLTEKVIGDTIDLRVQFTANSGINVSDFEDPANSAEQIITEYVADGGNLELDLALSWNSDATRANSRFIGYFGGYYSILTTDALSTKEECSGQLILATSL